MFRSDRDALADKVDDLTAENERLRAQNEAMRHDLLAQRTAEAPAPGVYKTGGAFLGEGERVALARHQLTAWPVWAAALLHVVTLGFGTFIHFNTMHGQLPKAERDDPSAGKAIGFHFIPYYNYYWIFWNGLRLADRVNLQSRLRGLPEGVSRQMIITACVLSVIPYVQMVAGPIAWLVVTIAMQRAVNRIVAYDEEARRERAGAGAPGVRIAKVADPPGTEEADEEQQAEDEAAAAEASPRRAARQ